MKKQLIAAGMVGLLGLSMVACSGTGAGGGAAQASGSQAPSQITVGVAMPDKTDQRWIADGNAVQAGLQKLGYNVDLEYAADDVPTQAQQIDQMITKGDKVLIIASIDGTALTSQLQEAAAAGIKVIAYDRLLMNSDNVDFYVSFDNFNVGVAQAKSFLYGLGLTDANGNKVANPPAGPMDIELFAGSPTDNNSQYDWNGAMSVLQPYLDDGTLVVKSGQTQFSQCTTANWDQATAQTRMENLLSSTYGGTGAGLKGVFSPYDGISRGIITALQGVGMGPTIANGLPIVTGQDAEIASVALINQGVQFSTIFKDTRQLAAEAVTAAQSYLSGQTPTANNTTDYNNGTKVVPSMLLQVDTVNKDNIQSELIDSGYYTQAQVDSGQQ